MDTWNFLIVAAFQVNIHFCNQTTIVLSNKHCVHNKSEHSFLSVIENITIHVLKTTWIYQFVILTILWQLQQIHYNYMKTNRQFYRNIPSSVSIVIMIVFVGKNRTNLTKLETTFVLICLFEWRGGQIFCTSNGDKLSELKCLHQMRWGQVFLTKGCNEGLETVSFWFQKLDDPVLAKI